MPDNITVTPGAGAVVGTDSVAGVQFQKVKIDVGIAGSSIPLVGDAVYGIPVDIRRFPAGAVLVNNPTATNLKVDASGVAVPITDNSGSLTVDAPAAAPVFVRLSNGSAAVDTIPVSGNVTVAQGTPAAAGNRWLVQLHDGTTGAAVDAGTGGLKVYVAGAAASAATLADKAAFTEGTSLIGTVGGEFIAAPSDPSDGHVAAARITQKRAFHTNLRDNSGVELGTSGNPVRTDPTGSTPQPVSGTITAKLKDDTGAVYGPSNVLYTSRGGRARTRVTKSVTLAASQTAVALWTPAGGKKFYIEKIVLVVTTAGPLKFFDGTDAAANQVGDSGVGNWATGSYVISFDEPWASATADNVLKYTSGSALVGVFTVHGFEV